MIHYTNRVCCGCASDLDTGFRCWNIECRLAGIMQTPPREAGAAQSPKSPKSQVHTTELKLTGMDTFGESGAHVGLQFNRVLTDHERASLEMMIRLFLKGYANAR